MKKITILTTFLLLISKGEAQDFYQKLSGRAISPAHNLVRHSGDTFLYHFLLQDTLEPIFNKACIKLINFNGTVLKDTSFDIWRDSSFFFIWIKKLDNGNFIGTGLTKDSCLELMEFDIGLRMLRYLKVTDSLHGTKTNGALSVSNGRIMAGGRCVSDEAYLYVIDLANFQLQAKYYFPISKYTGFFPGDCHFNARDSAYYFVSAANSKVAPSTIDCFITRLTANGVIDTVVGATPTTAGPLDSTYVYFDPITMVHENDSLFYLGTTAVVSNISSPDIRRYPAQLMFRYSDLKKLKEHIYYANPAGDDGEIVGTQNLIKRGDTLYQLTAQRTKKQFRVLAFDKNLNKVGEDYLPFSTHQVSYPKWFSFEYENGVLYSAGSEYTPQPLAYQPYVLFQKSIRVSMPEFYQNMPELSAFPNPARDQLRINATKLSGAKFSIYNSLGLCVRSGDANDGAVNLSGLDAGIYFLSFKTDTGSTVCKFLKEE